MQAAIPPSIGPVANHLIPDPPEGEYFTPIQWTTLLAIMDTVIPSIRKESTALASGKDDTAHVTISDSEYQKAVDNVKKRVVDAPDNDIIEAYLADKPSTNPKFLDLLKRTLQVYIREDGRKGISFILSTLNTRVGSLVLTGYATPIQDQTVEIRQAILERWRTSYLSPMNIIYKSLTTIAKNIWLKTSPTFEQASGYARTPKDSKPGPSFEYEFKQFKAASESAVVETDVVIVGSGCGGAVCAKNLAEAGHRVIVVDKGYYFKTEHLPMEEVAAGINLFDNGGADMAEDGSISVVSGSTWGGGGTINWAASLQTQGFVRKEWAEDRGLKFFGTAEFQTCLDRVCQRMGVSADHIRHNHGNETLLEGSRKLGYTAKTVPQNTAGTEHYDGHCALGCCSGEKAGTTVTWLPDAAKAGAEFIEGFKVDRVIFEHVNGTKRAVGVKGTWSSRNPDGGFDGQDKIVREVVVKAKKVIISCGTLWSPIVLMNSGLKNPQIGRNLYLHPVMFATGTFKEDVRPWEGGILTSVCTTFENLDGHGHGAKLEATCMLPSLSLTFANWSSGLDYKLRLLKYRHMNSFISIVRDRDPGRIVRDPHSGNPVIQYTPSPFDRANILEGILALAKILYVQGAEEIHVSIAGFRPFIRNPDDASNQSPSITTEEDLDLGVTDPRFTAWLDEIKKIGNKPPMGIFACAHQMGTNRMSVNERDGVVDPKGKVWGTEGLYVSDASIFPSASGVNPMITNMAISDWISRGISKELRSDGLVGARL
ncbi:hypothetical protein F5884DRAFT_187284 [Xylogone sp. PMI_703]|nr:hypothetical protein F5884DRAFT_187284 [Xylogone sp. PMI_703]